jgi:branched-chain amino acid transport system permease protein
MPGALLHLAAVPDLKPFVVTGLATGAVYGLSGIGLVVLHRATGVVNFAFGAIGAVGALTAWQLEKSVPGALAWAACLIVTVSLSLAYGETMAARMDRREPTVKAVSTLGFALVLLGLAFSVWSGSDRAFSLPTDSASATIAGVRITGTQFTSVGLAIVITAVVTMLLRRTRLGLSMRAMADDGQLSALLGVPVARVRRSSWALSGLIGGLSGLLVADLVRLDAATLTFLVIPGIAAAVVARLRSLTVTLVAGLGLGIVEAIGAPFASIASYRGIAPFAIAILILFLRGKGPLAA